MTAPNATTAPGTGTRARRAPGRRDDRDTSRPRSSSAQRALARRQKRLEAEQAVVAAGGHVRETSAERALRRHREGPAPALLTRLPKAPAALARRVPFVLAVIGLVGAGLVLTLWLSTGSAENSYELSSRERVNDTLAEKRAALERDVKAGESAPGLAQRATELGMVPAGTLPVLVAAPDGKVTVVGKPAPATGSPKPALNPPAPTTGQDSQTGTAGSGAPSTANPGAGQGGGEQLVTMNSGTPAVANTAPTQGATPSPAPPAATPAPAPAAGAAR
ncbi:MULTISPECIES: hypothetical protein [Tsukamurella]|uniref:Cell division protein FtsL n=1 Tax=Tsukamurella strandjordii TaxID=147577 RepID=A0AA90NCT7_9ACTN|nr:MULTISPECIES: hypothetical protein [Tsukamurella]MDP0399483.1 hypothetical protein [Tsukamurella strandjordii]GIZ95658.1 hypothetical protein TTY48_02700 [Tsukamurella sp. TY48]